MRRTIFTMYRRRQARVLAACFLAAISLLLTACHSHTDTPAECANNALGHLGSLTISPATGQQRDRTLSFVSYVCHSGNTVWAQIYSGGVLVRNTKGLGYAGYNQAISKQIHFSEPPGSYSVYLAEGPTVGGTPELVSSVPTSIEISGASMPRLLVYSGYDQYVNGAEVLSYSNEYHNHAYHGYFISIQARNSSDQIVHSGTVSFSYTPNDGLLSIPSANIGSVATDLAIPDVEYMFDTPTGTRKYYTVTASMSISGTNATASFPLTIQPDMELSGLFLQNPPLHLERSPAYPYTEVPGDGTADYLQFYPPPYTMMKHVLVEVDYYSGFPERSLIGSIMSEVKAIWAAYGVDIEYVADSYISNSIDQVAQYATWDNAKTLLADNRNMNGYLHIVIGRDYDPTWPHQQGHALIGQTMDLYVGGPLYAPRMRSPSKWGSQCCGHRSESQCMRDIRVWRSASQPCGSRRELGHWRLESVPALCLLYCARDWTRTWCVPPRRCRRGHPKFDAHGP